MCAQLDRELTHHRGEMIRSVINTLYHTHHIKGSAYENDNYVYPPDKRIYFIAVAVIEIFIDIIVPNKSTLIMSSCHH